MYQNENNQQNQIAVLGCGCFWCSEAIFQGLRGVISVEPGYAGGKTDNPTYDSVSTGKTGHAEVARIIFDPQIISYRDILEVFFALHNPTTLNRQGNDIGSQYRSIILYQNEEQKKIAQDIVTELGKEHAWPDPIVTEISQFKVFYPAEDYHKDYYKTHKDAPYCQFNISPKLTKLRKKYSRLIED